MLEALDAAAVARWSQAAVRSLEAHRAEIDDLNVFPVPDGDTGTNLAITIRAGADLLAATEVTDVGTALAVFARGAVLGARGNSGVIISQFLRGLADSVAAAACCDAPALAGGLRLGAEEARAAVAEPVEGTMLSVADAVATAAASTLAELVQAAVRAAEQAVRQTPYQLAELARAGVVDAGGRGLLVLLAALAATVTGEADDTARAAVPASPRPAQALQVARESGSNAYQFEVQYLLDAADTGIDTLRASLSALGDSVAVVGTGDGTWNVHAHVNDVGAAIEAGVQVGRPRRISVVRFADEWIGRPAAVADAEPRVGAPGAGTAPQPGSIAVVAVAPGPGLAHLFQAEGVQVVDGSAAAPPSADDVLAAVRAVGTAEVVVLSAEPGETRRNSAAESAAEQARAEGLRVAVVPTRSSVQGLAAVAVHNARGRFDDDVVAMAEAAAATRFAEITIATRQALTSVGICQQGDVLGLIDGEVVEIGHELVAVAVALVERLLGVGAELMTVLVGAGAAPDIGARLARHVQQRAPLTEVNVYAGGQPDHPLIIGVE